MTPGKKMNDMIRPINRVIIESCAGDSNQARSILDRLPNIPIETDNQYEPTTDMPLDMDKETLRLVDYKGDFLKSCPGTKEYICCGYQILNVGTNCPFDCSYCILQAYFNQPALRVFTNLEEKLNSIGALIDSNPDKIYRIGTGEFTDSLAIDPVTDWSGILTRFFKDRKNAVLEFKTKTDIIDGMLRTPYRDRIIISWSLNSSEVTAREEHGAPPIIKRIKAAKRCQEEGYVTGFHFDPLIHYKGWEKGYLKTIELLDKYIDPKRVIWISMGCFRYIPVLKSFMRRRHPDTRLLDGEFITGMDGKMRYFRPIRTEIFSRIKEYLDAWDKDLGAYLCMESNDVWRDSFGWSPGDSDGLARYLDSRVTKIYIYPPA